MRSPACKQIQGTGPDDSVRVDTGLTAVTEEMIMQGLEKLV